MLLQQAQPLAGEVVRPYWFGQLPYQPTWRAMQAYTSARNAESPDELWLLEHPPVFTQGQAGKPEHVLQLSDIPIVPIDRGGQVTYHGPGQLVGYLMVDLSRRKLGVREYVRRIEQSLIELLAEFGITAYGKVDAPGVYVDEAKIASLGLRIRNGKSYHGLALNVNMDLGPFGQINPCGYAGLQVTQLADLGVQESPASLAPRLAAKINTLLAQEGSASIADYALSSKPVTA
ncbi:lipoyl(octanoyl) transferase LipB [Chitinimonas naiadis]